MLKNDLLLKALRGEDTPRPPVWMMRQAGRYLPEFRALRERYDFFTRCKTPELAAEITMQPIRILEPDAAILFSDILVVPMAMGVDIQMKSEAGGPFVPHPIASKEDIDRLVVENLEESLSYVFEAVKIVKQLLKNEMPLLGFAGSPWTILCYLVQGQGSKTYDKAKKFCFERPDLAAALLGKITDATISYLKIKVKTGVDAVQIFDSWGGVLSAEDFRLFSLPYIARIVKAISPLAPTIVFAKGCTFALKDLSELPVSALGIDWTCSAQTARREIGDKITLQGNFDPARLHSPVNEIKKMTSNMISEFGLHRYIANLGHGILPDIPVKHAKAFIDAVKTYGS